MSSGSFFSRLEWGDEGLELNTHLCLCHKIMVIAHYCIDWNSSWKFIFDISLRHDGSTNGSRFPALNS
jgi:hypothetical protein